MKILNIKTGLFLSTSIVASIFFIGCTNLEIDNVDSIIPEEEGGNPTEILNALYRSFAGNYNTYEQSSGLQNMPSDLMITPIRTTGDWANGGRFIQIHTHEWTPNQEDLNSVWSRLNRNIFNASEVIFYGGSNLQVAEAKFLRAFAMWQLLDFFGVVPVRQVDEPVTIDPKVYTRKEALQFVIQDLNEAVADLPSLGPSNHDFATKEAVYALQARIALNKAVYESEGPGTFSFNVEDMNNVIANADKIINSGYALDDDYFVNWRGEGTENIFVSIDNMSKLWQPYLSSNQGGWNGFSITPELYDLYESDDDRLGKGPGTSGYVFNEADFDPADESVLIPQGILVGKQYKKNGEELSGIDYQKNVKLLGADPNEGFKMMKNSPDADTKFVFLRLGDVVLMKAEAILRGGSSSDSALDIINELRDKRNATPLVSITLDDILAERGREMQWDAIRRTDQIRFGTFLSGTWTEKKAVSEDYRWVYPIPALQVALNPNLEQNPGYPDN
ncbi:RagB/SusD family nutrient uptake outer membrane protein [Arenibacter sp. M-2]|uniref:RagB/SusD family nutrient uptake outer membrane protein n=1 Tax=unclassified Arenibacter TaxID=2615047 RepID=UPI000D768BDF|nr:MULTISPECIES: RagB/SusD family nutrient uptake outer membrane protein [unclassified Arenibacter]MDL5510370.1 RagB/SusD family nutrient uptake outer membrane protein [Arenibacter sp. M-2]PXX31236.1 putative outer membrane starch-binding protein [Arenibacter sp. ARW7G5Y1]|tara:strand:- start:20458 stop:21966 length:1509 start_codon:yes stop_codon:yes gene_type:complete